MCSGWFSWGISGTRTKSYYLIYGILWLVLCRVYREIAVAIWCFQVRSTASQVGFDVRHCLGFLSNPKRFNVAITRAQSLLLIVGDPFVLATVSISHSLWSFLLFSLVQFQDGLWRRLICYCIDHQAYAGCDLRDLDVNGLQVQFSDPL